MAFVNFLTLSTYFLPQGHQIPISYYQSLSIIVGFYFLKWHHNCYSSLSGSGAEMQKVFFIGKL
jgi:hypothetical protein